MKRHATDLSDNSEVRSCEVLLFTPNTGNLRRHHDLLGDDVVDIRVLIEITFPQVIQKAFSITSTTATGV